LGSIFYFEEDFMKKFLFGMIAVLSVSLFLIGCPTDPEDGAAGAAGAAGAPGEAGADGPNNFNGKPSVQAIQSAVDSGAKIQLDNVEIQGGGTLDFKTADVTVYGTLASAATDPLYIVATSATLTFAEGANIAPGTGDFFFGTAEQVAKAKEGVTNVVEAVAALADATGTVTAVKDLKLSKDLKIPSTLKVYVYGTLEVGAADANPDDGYGDGIVAIGTVEVTATNATALSAATNVDVTKATILYEGNTTVAITLPATLSSPTFKVTNEQGVLQVLGTTSFSGYVTANNGVVEFGAAVTAATITGNGRIRFANGTTATAFATTSSIEGTRIEFPNGFSTAQNAPLTLGGEVYIGDGKTITLSTSDTTGTLTLKDGSTIYAKPAGDPVLLVTANNAGSTVVLTPVAGAVLTAAATGKSLTLSVQDLTLTEGEIEVAAGATLDVGNLALTVSGTLDVKGTLSAGTAGVTVGDATNKAAIKNATIAGATLAGGTGTVTLASSGDITLSSDGTNAGVVTTAGSGSVVAGATTFSGVGTWTASKSADTITGVKISSAAAGATIAAVGTTGTGTLTASGTAPVITQASGSGNGLTIAANTVVALGGDKDTAAGTITLTAAGSNGGKLVLAAATSFIRAGDETTAGTALSGTTVKIDEKTLTLTTITAANLKNGATGGNLIEVGGAAGSIEANTASQTVVISSAVAATAS
jgi:hypothetical protein